MGIETTWDGDVITTHDPVQLTLSACPDGKHVIVKVNAPLFNDPQPPNTVPAGKPCPRLWDYEGNIFHVDVKTAMLMQRKNKKSFNIKHLKNPLYAHFKKASMSRCSHCMKFPNLNEISESAGRVEYI